ncbi:MAG: guanylate kinase [Acidobacteriota bacterium]
MSSESQPVEAAATVRGELILLAAPSGAGKTTLVDALLERQQGRIVFSVSHTTRSPRGRERDGEDYHFIDRARFEAMVAADRFLEWAEVHGNLYGTSKDEVEPRLEAGTDVLLDVDVQGADQLRRRYPGILTVLVLPPSYRDLERRLRSRGLDDAAVITRRLAASVREIECYESFDCVIINDDASLAAADLAAVIAGRRCRMERMRPRVEQILEDFRRSAPR